MFELFNHQLSNKTSIYFFSQGTRRPILLLMHETLQWKKSAVLHHYKNSVSVIWMMQTGENSMARSVTSTFVQILFHPFNLLNEKVQLKLL